MSSIKKIVGIVIIILVFAVIAVVWYRHPGLLTSGVGANIPSTATINNSSTLVTRTAVPAGSSAPNQGSVAVAANVAIPIAQGAGDPAGNVAYRSFNITIQGNTFSPDTVIVNQGDTVNLEVSALDANDTFTQPDYGFNTTIAEGKTQTIQFQALQSGNFIFYCSSCGGPTKGPVGHLIVVAK